MGNLCFDHNQTVHGPNGLNTFTSIDSGIFQKPNQMISFQSPNSKSKFFQKKFIRFIL